MATKLKEGAHGKERKSSSLSTPQNIHSPHGRRTPKSAGAGSPGRDTSVLLEKSTPQYLKPTSSSTHESNKPSKKPTSIDLTTKSLTRKMSMEKPPSPAQTQRTPPTASPKEKPLKPSSFPSPKSVSSPKLISDKTPKTLRNGKVQPLLKAKTLKRETSLKKREIKASPTATSSDDIAKKSVHMPDKQEDKAVKEITVEMLEVEVGEQATDEIQPFPDISSNTSFPLEEHDDEIQSPEVEEEGDKKNCTLECSTNQEEKEPGNDDDEEHEDGEHPQQLEEDSAIDDTHEWIKGEKEEEDGTGAGNDSKKESENVENERLELKERDVASIEDPKLETEKAVPKQQHIHGKKDAPAYNDVIEETASKLVEKRKSKVLALVGAFETVISLQEPERQGGQQKS